MLMSQATRVLVAHKDPAFFFYHNPRWSIERFLGRTTWLDESRVEAARWKLMDDFFVKLSALRANVAQDIKVIGPPPLLLSRSSKPSLALLFRGQFGASLRVWEW